MTALRRRRPDRGPSPHSPEWVREQRERSIDLIASPSSDFTAVYYAVYGLRSLLEDHPEAADPRTLRTLEALLKREDFAEQRQGLFLFRQAALTLMSIMLRRDGDAADPDPLGRHALKSLHRVLAVSWGHAHRAVAETLGSLPAAVSGPALEADPSGGTRRTAPLDLDRLLTHHGLKTSDLPRTMGRSRIFGLSGDGRILAIKATRNGERPDGLLDEVRWMRHLETINNRFPVRFDIPRPLSLDGAHLFRLNGASHGLRSKGGRAIAFLAHKDYFTYPAGPGSGDSAPLDLQELMGRNAWLLGKLAGLGIVHTAPIPLFHNRVQAERRRDGGRYEWFRAGRLDRWLSSCDYPNLGATGLRDFEHLASVSDRETNLYRHIGAHFMSLFLVLGAYFRGKAPRRRGLDDAGAPVDVRHLFDPDLLIDVVKAVFHRYYEGFVEEPFDGDIPLDIPELARRMIEEMGVDRHMEEVLRTPDQDEMSFAEFRAFLEERGFSETRIAALPKGAADIVFHSGPHLGGFNRPISLPELIRAVETFSGLCMAGRCLRRRAAGDVHWTDWKPPA